MAQEENNDRNPLLAVVLWVIPLLLLLLIVELWPVQTQVEIMRDKSSQTGITTLSPGAADTKIEWLDKTNILKTRMDFAVRLLLLVCLLGAMGSSVHAATSFAAHKGKGDFKKNWVSWYLLRMPVGAGLALIITLLVEGKMFILPGNSGEVKPFGFLGLAALVGLFSRQALEKLSDVFDTMFASNHAKNNKASGGNPSG